MLFSHTILLQIWLLNMWVSADYLEVGHDAIILKLEL